MPRSARVLCPSGIYHVMVRGVNKQKIFEEEADYRRFVRILRRCKENSAYKLFAYCLMNNHVHLLIKTEEKPLDVTMKRIAGSYAHWFNEKYARKGHLFQDRYLSETVDSERYFLTLLRYIMQNPMKAGLEKCPGTYPWSSYEAYCGQEDFLTDTDFALTIFEARREALSFFNQFNRDKMMDVDDSDNIYSDNDALKELFLISDCQTVSEFLKLPKKNQRGIVRKLHQNGVRVGQISRLTGKSRSTIMRYTD